LSGDRGGWGGKVNVTGAGEVVSWDQRREGIVKGPGRENAVAGPRGSYRTGLGGGGGVGGGRQMKGGGAMGPRMLSQEWVVGI
jgi:hypothetical protein